MGKGCCCIWASSRSILPDRKIIQNPEIHQELISRMIPRILPHECRFRSSVSSKPFCQVETSEAQHEQGPPLHELKCSSRAHFGEDRHAYTYLVDKSTPVLSTMTRHGKVGKISENASRHWRCVDVGIETYTGTEDTIETCCIGCWYCSFLVGFCYFCYDMG